MISISYYKPLFKLYFLSALVAFFILPSCVRAEAEAFKRRYSTTIRDILPWSENRAFVINEKGGSIIIGAEKRKNIRLKGIRTCFAPELSAARQRAGDIKMLLESRNEVFSVSTSLPGFWPPDISGRIDYFLSAPATSQFTLKTFTGDISVSGISGKIDAATISGDIQLTDNKAPLTISSVSGDIFAARSPSIATLSTVTGEIRLRIEKMDSDRLDISTFSGPVNIRIAAGSDVSINTSTVMGRIEIKTPEKIEIVSQEQNNAIVRAGDGTKHIYIRTVSGAITIEGFEENDTGKRR